MPPVMIENTGLEFYRIVIGDMVASYESDIFELNTRLAMLEDKLDMFELNHEKIWREAIRKFLTSEVTVTVDPDDA